MKKGITLESLISEGDARMEHRIPEEAIPFYTQALEIDPENSSVWNSLGLASYLMKDLSKALMSYDKALQIDPSNSEAWKNKGNVLVKLNRYPEAHSCFDTAIQKNPENLATIWTEKGMTYYREKEYDAAIACFDTALQIEPKRQDSLVGKGSALCQLGHFKEAIHCYDQVLQINPISTRARVYRKIALDKFDKVGGKSQSRIKDFS